jgi:hypothetical protein
MFDVYVFFLLGLLVGLGLSEVLPPGWMRRGAARIRAEIEKRRPDKFEGAVDRGEFPRLKVIKR